MVVMHVGLGLPEEVFSRRIAQCEDGSQLPYYVGGSGPALVLINAHGQDLLVFSELASRLQRQWMVVAWKPRGTFDDRERRFGVHDQLEDLGRIVRCEHLDAFGMISWCSGAKVALEFARRSPAVRGVVLANGTFAAFPGAGELETPFERNFLEMCRAVMRMPQLAQTMRAAMMSALTGTNASHTKRTNSRLNKLILEPFESLDATLRYASQVVDYMSHDVGPALAEVHAPVLLLSGASDSISSPKMAQHVARSLSHSSSVEVAGGSHYVLYENPDRSYAEVDRFFRNTDLCA